MNRDFWGGKRVLITGHTGFKGGWMATWLQAMGADVAGIGLAPNTVPSFFETSTAERGAPHEEAYLKVDSSKARQVLGWRPRLSVREAVEWTVAWYRQALTAAANTNEMYEFTRDQIKAYEARGAPHDRDDTGLNVGLAARPELRRGS